MRGERALDERGKGELELAAFNTMFYTMNSDFEPHRNHYYVYPKQYASIQEGLARLTRYKSV